MKTNAQMKDKLVNWVRMNINEWKQMRTSENVCPGENEWMQWRTDLYEWEWRRIKHTSSENNHVPVKTNASALSDDEHNQTPLFRNKSEPASKVNITTRMSENKCV